jgi:hypothetical protein
MAGDWRIVAAAKTNTVLFVSISGIGISVVYFTTKRHFLALTRDAEPKFRSGRPLALEPGRGGERAGKQPGKGALWHDGVLHCSFFMAGF